MGLFSARLCSGEYMKEKLKLHLGCGSKILKDYINIDIDNKFADLKIDATRLPYEENSIDLIYCSHMIEHLKRNNISQSLKHWYFILKFGGELQLSTPDFESICRHYIENKDVEKVLGLLVGGQRDLYDFHRSLFDFNFLSKILLDIGFKSVERVDWKKMDPYKNNKSFDDYSSAYLPHMDKKNGQLMSLNVVATK